LSLLSPLPLLAIAAEEEKKEIRFFSKDKVFHEMHFMWSVLENPCQKFYSEKLVLQKILS